jgi:hypothetical protein
MMRLARIIVMVLLAGINCRFEAATNAPQTPTEKALRTPAQQKIDSQLLYEIYRRRGEAELKRVPPETTVKVDADGRVTVDVRAEVSAQLERKVVELGGVIVETSEKYRSILAHVPLMKLETLAEEAAVVSIIPAPEPALKRPPLPNRAGSSVHGTM